MPPIIYGTAWKEDRTQALVVEAMHRGFRGIDTACQPRHYREDQVGLALRYAVAHGLVRSEIYVQTKFTPVSGQDPDTIPYDPDLPIEEQVGQSFNVSLKNLGTEYLDALLLHSPLPTWEETLRAWRAMEELHARGGALRLGISNCYDLRLARALFAEAKVPPALLQNRFYAVTGYDAALRAWCNEQGVVYQSFWTLTANPDVLDSGTVRDLAGKHRKSAPQILFRYLSQTGVVPLTGTTSTAHMLEDLAVFEFTLTPEEMDRMHPLFTGGAG